MSTNQAAALLAEAQACLAQQDLTAARDRYARICELQPAHPDSWLMLGALDGELGRVDDAVASVQKATELDSRFEEAFLALAHLYQKAGNHDAAGDAARKALDIDDNYGEAWLFLAALQGERRNYAASLEYSQKAAQLLPASADAHANLGNALQQTNDFAGAEAEYRRADRLQPNRPEFQAGIANALVSQGNPEAARELLEQALSAAPESPELYTALGNALFFLQELEAALESYRKRLELTPGFTPGRIHLGTALLRMKRPDEAEPQLRAVLESGDVASMPMAYSLLGGLRMEEGKPEIALDYYRKALALDPGFLLAQESSGRALEALGRFEEALEEYRRAAALLPESAEMAGNQASALQRLGESTEAQRLITPYLAPDRINVRIAEVFSRICDQTGRCDEAIDLLEGLLGQSLDPGDRRSLYYALGKLQDRAGHYDAAFTAYRAANDLKHRAYDASGFSRYIDSILSNFSEGILELLPRPQARTGKLVFIVGMPRSGTSLVEQILASHPDVYGAGELRAMHELVDSMPALLGGMPYPDCMSSMTQQVADHLCEQYMSRINELAPDAQRVTDKLPHNFLHLGLIRVLFPGARILHCVRDAMDTCLSCYFQEFSGYHPYAYDLHDLGTHYREYRRLMDYWKNTAAIPMLEISYEDLVANQERITREMLEFCGLEWDERCLKFHDSARISRTASADQVRQPIYQGSVGRWHKYESYLAGLKQSLGVS